MRPVLGIPFRNYSADVKARYLKPKTVELINKLVPSMTDKTLMLWKYYRFVFLIYVDPNNESTMLWIGRVEYECKQTDEISSVFSK